jgi:hypothetical protein
MILKCSLLPKRLDKVLELWLVLSDFGKYLDGSFQGSFEHSCEKSNSENLLF